MRTIIVTGHSAGGHLALAHMAADWRTFGLPPQPLAGVMSLSGVFDVTPLIQTSLNTDLRLTPETAAALNLNHAKPLCTCPLILAVGGDESFEFHRQSKTQAEAWSKSQPKLLDVLGLNHFTIVDSLADANGALNAEVMALLA